MSFIYAEQAGSAPDAPLIVLLHGFGSDELDLMGLAPVLPEGYAILCPRGPRETPFGGCSWFDLEWDASGVTGGDEAQLWETVAELGEWLTQIRADKNPRELILGGFSQGAAVAVAVTSRFPELVDRLAVLSGRWLGEKWPEMNVLPPTLAQHGLRDHIIPIQDGRALHGWIRARRPDAEIHEYDMGHEISPASLHGFVLWLQNSP